MNVTLKAFGYPETCIYEDDHWSVVLRPQQATLASCVLICKEEITSLGQVSAEAMAVMPGICRRLEKCLRDKFEMKKANYLALMMVDPNVHFHVIPRYDGERAYGDMQFYDPGWPKLPDISHAHELPQKVREQLTVELKTDMEWVD